MLFFFLFRLALGTHMQLAMAPFKDGIDQEIVYAFRLFENYCNFHFHLCEHAGDTLIILHKPHFFFLKFCIQTFLLYFCDFFFFNLGECLGRCIQSTRTPLLDVVQRRLCGDRENRVV